MCACSPDPTMVPEEFDLAIGRPHPKGKPLPVEKKGRSVVPTCQRLALGASMYIPIGDDSKSWAYAHFRQAQDPLGGLCMCSTAPLGATKDLVLVADRIMMVTRPFAVHATATNSVSMAMADLDAVARCQNQSQWSSCYQGRGSDEDDETGDAPVGGQGSNVDGSKDSLEEKGLEEEFAEELVEEGDLPRTDGYVDVAVNVFLEAVVTKSPDSCVRFEAALFQYELAEACDHYLYPEDLVGVSFGRLAALLLYGKDLIPNFTQWPEDSDAAVLIAEVGRWLGDSSAVVYMPSKVDHADRTNVRASYPTEREANARVRPRAVLNTRAQRPYRTWNARWICIRSISCREGDRRSSQCHEQVLQVLRLGLDDGLEGMLQDQSFPPRNSLTEGINFSSFNGEPEPTRKIPLSPPYLPGAVHVTVFGPVLTSKAVVKHVEKNSKSMYCVTRGELAPTEHFRWKTLGKFGQADFSCFSLGYSDTRKQAVAWCTSVSTAFGKRWPGLFRAENCTIVPVDPEATFFVLYNWGGRLKRKTDQAVQSFIATAIGQPLQIRSAVMQPVGVR